MKVRRKLTRAHIQGPRERCWRCNGRRVVATIAGSIVPCSSCNGRDPLSRTQPVCEQIKEAA